MTGLSQLLPEITLLLTALLILVLDLLISDKLKKYMPVVAIAGVVAGLGLTIAQWGNDATVLRVIVHDSITYLAYILVFLTMVGLVLISSSYIHKVSDNAPFFYALLMLHGLAALLLISTTNILMLVLALEFLSITAYVLTGYLHYSTRSTEAAIKYLIYGSVISALMMYGFSWLYGLTGHTDYIKIAESLAQPGLWFAGVTFSPKLILPTLIFLSVGLAFKIAAAPFHQWAPDAYEGSPTPVTAMLATVPKIAGFVMILRVYLLLFPSSIEVGQIWQTPLLSILSTVTMLLGSLGGLLQTDVKRMMAYSGITQAGYALMGLATGAAKGVEAQLIYLIAYVIAEIAIFAVISNVVVPEEPADVGAFRGLYHRSPLLALAMLIALLSLTGLPGTIGFIGKFTLFTVCLEKGYLWLAVVGVVNTVISFGYYWKLIRMMWLETAETIPVVPIEWPTFPVVTMGLISIVGIGLFPNSLVQFISLIFQRL